MRAKGVYSSPKTEVAAVVKWHVMPQHLGGRRRAARASVSGEGNQVYSPSSSPATAQLS